MKFTKRAIFATLFSLLMLLGFAEREKVVQIFRGGEVIQEYSIADIDYIEVNDRLGAPAGIEAATDEKSITISWQPVEGATYNLYRSADNVNFSLLAEGLTETTYTDTDPLTGSNFYKVKALVGGLESPYTQTASAVIPDSGLPSGIYLGIYGFSKDIQPFEVRNLTEENSASFHSFIDNLTATDAHTALYYAVEKSIDNLAGTQFPEDLSEVAIITFTDGLDISSLDKKDQDMGYKLYKTNKEYRDALQARLSEERISGLNISSYTIGVIGNRGNSLTTFRANMSSLASSPSNIKEVERMDDVNQIFQDIANSLSETKYVQQIKLTISGQSHNEKCKFTFGNVGGHEYSDLYIIGTYDRDLDALKDIEYVGMSSTSGPIVYGKYNEVEEKYDFVFEGLQTNDGTLIPVGEGDVMHWLTDEGIWQDYDDEFFFDPDDASLQKIKKSAGIILNLDCSSSMNDKDSYGRDRLSALKEAANSFVRRLVDNSVNQLDVASVVLDNSNLTLPIGQTSKLKATVFPETALLKTVTWSSSDPDIASVDEDGMIIAHSPGTATITVTTKDGGYTASCEVRVVTWVEEITLSPSSVEVYNGETVSLTATVLPDEADEKEVLWSSSDTEIATVDENGVVTGVSRGDAVIKATSKDGSDVFGECRVSVLQHVESVSLDFESLTMNTGETRLLSATVYPDNASNKNVVWSSSDDNIATVDENGVVTALSNGTVEISACGDRNEVKGTCIVKIGTLATEIVLNPTSVEIYNGESVRLAAEVLPTQTSDKGIIWTSSNNDIATVDDDGNVTGVSRGEAVIRATSKDGSNIFAECVVSVLQPVESVVMNTESLTIYVGTGYQLSASVFPANSSNCKLLWRSSNEKIATVDENGYVTGGTNGKVDIIALSEEGEKQGICAVEVRTLVEEILLDTDRFNVYNGEKFQLEATVLPETASDKTLIWDSSNPEIATVDENGNVTGVSAGEAIISATTIDGSEKKSLSVACVLQHVEEVKLSTQSITMEVGNSTFINVSILPEDASNKNFRVVCSDNSVAEVAGVSGSVRVQGLSVGTATITVISEEGELAASCVLNITPATTGSINGHDWVDLGLPSGLKWATCNVGANNAFSIGTHYKWEEISNTSVESTWGSTWRVPTDMEMEELINECEWDWSSVNGQLGCSITGPNGKSIFLPSSGYISSISAYDEADGFYWTSTAIGKSSPQSVIKKISISRPSTIRNFGVSVGNLHLTTTTKPKDVAYVLSFNSSTMVIVNGTEAILCPVRLVSE